MLAERRNRKEICITGNRRKTCGFSFYNIDICQNWSILKKATYVENDKEAFLWRGRENADVSAGCPETTVSPP
ncbi:MAG: hypothetical protein J6I95_02560, partial [Anaerotignum sp.]|nr:hypothetical protein [Anaerotignum sp.]